MTKRCYITTPIYYANGGPHIGTTYTTLIADVLARSKRILWYQVKFTTGTDENGQKMKQTAESEGKQVMEYLDEIEVLFRNAWEELQISYTDYIRTTHPTHHAFVQTILEEALAKDHVYQWEYEGMYCLWCESFKKDSDLIEHEWNMVCPDHLTAPDVIKEKNRFFRLSNFEEKLKEFYKKHEKFAQPWFRYNEVTSFVEQWLEDFSISREGSDFGIRLPDNFQDPNSVVYIWFDALYNYLTTCLYPWDFTKNWQSISGEKDDMTFWHDAEVIHTIGKDISRFHAVYRPAMLMSSEYKIPDTEIINGFFTVDGQKMSKSLGNKIDPLELIAEHGRDALVYYLFSDIKIGNDGDFSRDRFSSTKENVLLKWWGNLVSRVSKLCGKYEIWSASTSWLARLRGLAEKEWGESNRLRWLFSAFDPDVIEEYLKSADYMTYLRDRFQLVQLGNQYMQQSEPWVKIKDPITEQEAREDLQTLLRLMKNLALLSSPFLIEWFEKIQQIINIQHPDWQSFQTFENEEDAEWTAKKFQSLFELEQFDVEFGEGHVY